MNRRSFIKNTGLTLGAGGITGISLAKIPNIQPSNEIDWDYSQKKVNPSDEAIWREIQKHYPNNPNIINLENGYFSHQALPVLKFHQELENDINSRHSVFMRTEQEVRIEETRVNFARYQECDKNELAFTRNTTESLNTAIMGFPWKNGDEVVMGNQDYGSMVEALKQCQRRWNIKLKVANIPIVDMANWEDTIINTYTSRISKQTKMVLLTHPINLNGMGIPIHRLITKIREFSAEICIIVDAAHALSHLPETIGDIKADIIGSSLHKWTGAPLGLGCLYIRKYWIPEIWPLMGDDSKSVNDIRKFEHHGTRPIQTIMSLTKAIEFNQKIGLENRLNRLLYLKYIWQGNQSGLKSLSQKTEFNIPFEELGVVDHTKSRKIEFQHPIQINQWQGAISTFSVKGISPDNLALKLKNEFNIFSVAINHPVINGVRITPQLSNSIEDVIALNQAIRKICS